MLIAICVFRRRMEEHKVLFIIAVMSTVKMTTGSQFKAAPRHSSLSWPAVVIPCRNVDSLSLPKGCLCCAVTAPQGWAPIFYFVKQPRDPIISSASEAALLYKHLKRKKSSPC